MDFFERNRAKCDGNHVHDARAEARAQRTRGGRTEEQASELREQAAKAATCCGECFRPLLPTDSVTMASCNIGRWRNPHWLRIPICLLCTLDAITYWPSRRNSDGWYSSPRWHRARCLNCSRPIRIYGHSLNARTCCADCQRAVRNRRNKVRRRVRHAPMICIACGRSFVPKRADAQTCSNRCRQFLHRHERGGVKQPLRNPPKRPGAPR